MKRLNHAALPLLALTGVLQLTAQPIPEALVPLLKGKNLVYITHKKPDFLAVTAGKAMIGGLFGGLAMVSAGNKIVTDNSIQDPAILASEHLVKTFGRTYSMTVMPAPEAPLEGKGISRILERCPGADYVLDIQTLSWGFAYFPTSPDHYKVLYTMTASLIDAKDKKSVASGKVGRDPKKTADAPTKDELLASGAERLKAEISRLAAGCEEELALKVFKLPMEGLPPAVDTQPVAGAAVPVGKVPGERWVDPVSGIEFVWIPAGSFAMGAKDKDDSGKLVHAVTLSRGFWMGRHEVTQRSYLSIMGANPAGLKNSGLDAPVEMVSWNDAKSFASKLSEKSGSGRYRLPTEAEWEYASRAGSMDLDPELIPSTAWCESNSGRTTQPVGKLRPNAWGLYDMLGNVWEWCEDWQGTESALLPSTDPAGPSTGTAKIARGGSWDSFERIPAQGAIGMGSPYYGAKVVNLVERYPQTPETRSNNLGFRVVIAP